MDDGHENEFIKQSDFIHANFTSEDEHSNSNGSLGRKLYLTYLLHAVRYASQLQHAGCIPDGM